jgi:hypothetical protein
VLSMAVSNGSADSRTSDIGQHNPQTENTPLLAGSTVEEGVHGSSSEDADTELGSDTPNDHLKASVSSLRAVFAILSVLLIGQLSFHSETEDLLTLFRRFYITSRHDTFDRHDW